MKMGKKTVILMSSFLLLGLMTYPNISQSALSMPNKSTSIVNLPVRIAAVQTRTGVYSRTRTSRTIPHRIRINVRTTPQAEVRVAVPIRAEVVAPKATVTGERMISRETGTGKRELRSQAINAGEYRSEQRIYSPQEKPALRTQKSTIPATFSSGLRDRGERDMAEQPTQSNNLRSIGSIRESASRQTPQQNQRQSQQSASDRGAQKREQVQQGRTEAGRRW